MLADPHPLDLLTLVSSLLAHGRPTLAHDPFAHGDDGRRAARPLNATSCWCRSSTSTGGRDVGGARSGSRPWTPDELLRVRIERELTTRVDNLPHWLRGRLRTTVAYRSLEQTGTCSATARTSSSECAPRPATSCPCLVYVDHNLGTVVKDGFAVPGPVAEFFDLMRVVTDDDPTCVERPRPRRCPRPHHRGDRPGAMTYPPFETERGPRPARWSSGSTAVPRR